jgi:hypothetical protein
VIKKLFSIFRLGFLRSDALSLFMTFRGKANTSASHILCSMKHARHDDKKFDAADDDDSCSLAGNQRRVKFSVGKAILKLEASQRGKRTIFSALIDGTQRAKATSVYDL